MPLFRLYDPTPHNLRTPEGVLIRETEHQPVLRGSFGRGFKVARSEKPGPDFGVFDLHPEEIAAARNHGLIVVAA